MSKSPAPQTEARFVELNEAISFEASRKGNTPRLRQLVDEVESLHFITEKTGETVHVFYTIANGERGATSVSYRIAMS